MQSKRGGKGGRLRAAPAAGWRVAVAGRACHGPCCAAWEEVVPSVSSATVPAHTRGAPPAPLCTCRATQPTCLATTFTWRAGWPPPPTSTPSPPPHVSAAAAAAAAQLLQLLVCLLGSLPASLACLRLAWRAYLPAPQASRPAEGASLRRSTAVASSPSCDPRLCLSHRPQPPHHCSPS